MAKWLTVTHLANHCRVEMCVTLVPSFHHCALSRWLQVTLVHSSLLPFCFLVIFEPL